LLDLDRNLIEPFLRAVSAILIVPQIGLKVFYPVFGSPKLERKLVSQAQRVLAVFFRHAGRPVEHTQNSLPCALQWIAAIRNQISRGSSKRDDGF